MKKIYLFFVSLLCLFSLSLAQNFSTDMLDNDIDFNLTNLESVKIKFIDPQNFLSSMLKSKIENHFQTVLRNNDIKTNQKKNRAALHLSIYYIQSGFTDHRIVCKLDLVEKVKSFRINKPIEAITFSKHKLFTSEHKDLGNTIFETFCYELLDSMLTTFNNKPKV